MGYKANKKYFSVLLVEDNADHALLEKEVLADMDRVRKVDVVNEAASAVSMIRNKHYDLILIDYNLPDKDGMQLMVEMKNIDNNAAFVMLSGMRDENIAVEVMKAGAYDYIKKDDDYLDNMRAKIETVIAKYQLKHRLDIISEELIASEIKLRALVNYSPSAVIMKDIKGKYVLLNRKAVELIAVLSDDILPEELKQGLSVTDKLILDTRCEKVIQQKLDIPGRLDYMEISKYPVLDDDGKVVFICNICRDITEMKKEEHVKVNVIRDISHEFKTPLAVINMAHYMSVRAAKDGNMDKILKAQEIIFKNLSRLHKNVDNVLELFKLDSPNKMLEPEGVVSLEETIKGILKDISYVVENKDIDIQVSIPGEFNNIFVGERIIRTLFYNVIDNAVKFTDKGRVLINACKEEEWLVIRVKDTGCGIGPDEKGKLFERFVQKHNAVPGTGVGLTICKEIVEMYEGEIDIDSDRKGSGATVTIKLPISRVRSEAPE